MTLHVAAYRDGDEAAILELYASAFDRQPDELAWRWRYLENPVGEPAIELMWDGDRLVGQYAVSLTHVQVDGEVVRACLSLDTMTHPDYGRRGIFGELANSLYERLARSDVGFVFGFPNDNSLPGFASRLGWSIEPDLVGLVTRQNPPTDESVSEIAHFDKADDLALTRLSPGQTFTHRSADYLNWRYVDRPAHTYKTYVLRDGVELSGYVVTKIFDSGPHLIGDVVDLFCDDPSTARRLLSGSVTQLLRAGAVEVTMWACPRSVAENAADLLGFERSGRSTHFGHRQLSPSTAPPDPSAWYLQMGDSDVY